MKKVIVDSHCDTIKEVLGDNGNLCDNKYQFNLADVRNSLPYIQYMAAYVSPEYDKNGIAFKRANDIIDKFYQQIGKYKEKITQINHASDIDRVIESVKLGAVLSIENGSAIEGNVSNVDYFFKRGVKCMSLVWNEDNRLSSGAMTKNDTGLTPLGAETVKRMNKMGMLVDVSHISKKGFWDTLRVNKGHIIATHSCVKKLCNHPRNLTDEQIIGISRNNGIIGVCFFTEFLKDKDLGRASMQDILRHIDYIVNLVGVDYVGIGTDFDGIGNDELPYGIEGVKDMHKVFEGLKDIGYKEKDILKIAGGNHTRVMREMM